MLFFFLAFSLSSFLITKNVWRLQSSCKQAILFWFLLRNVLSAPALPSVLPFIHCTMNLLCFHPVGHNTPIQQCYCFPLSAGRGIWCVWVLPLVWRYSDTLPHTLHLKSVCIFCDFWSQDPPLCVNLLALLPLYSIFETGLISKFH